MRHLNIAINQLCLKEQYSIQILVRRVTYLIFKTYIIMKKAAVLSLLVVASSTSLFSQYRHYSSDENVIDYSSNFYRWGLYTEAKANQKVTITRKNKKGKIRSVKTNHFNEDTLVDSYQHSDGFGKEKFRTLSTYEGKHLMGKEAYKKGSLKYRTKNTFDGKYRISYTKTDSKGSILTKNESTFTEKEFETDILNRDFPVYRGKKLKTSKIYKKGGVKQKSKWIYEYDDQGKRTITTLYNAKNDLKFTWDYTCKSEGELVAKNRQNFCKWQENEDGMLIEVTRKTSPKGKVQKIIKKYNADTSLVAQEIYLDDIISQKVSYDKSVTRPLSWESYKKGNLKFKFTYVYAKNGKLLNTKSFKGKDGAKVLYESNYKYKGEQLVVVENHSNGKLVRSFVVSYN